MGVCLSSFGIRLGGRDGSLPSAGAGVVDLYREKDEQGLVATCISSIDIQIYRCRQIARYT